MSFHPLSGEPLSGQTAAAAASASVGSLTATLGTLTASATGSLAINGTLSATLGALTASAAGELGELPSVSTGGGGGGFRISSIRDAVSRRRKRLQAIQDALESAARKAEPEAEVAEAKEAVAEVIAAPSTLPMLDLSWVESFVREYAAVQYRAAALRAIAALQAEMDDEEDVELLLMAA